MTIVLQEVFAHAIIVNGIRTGIRTPRKGHIMQTLRELREGAGLTQLELANQLGVIPGTIYNWERGYGEPRARQVAELARILGVSADTLLAALPEPADRTAPEKRAA